MTNHPMKRISKYGKVDNDKMGRNECEINDKRRTTTDTLPIKEFAARNSVLTDLWDNKHIRTIYHIFIAMLIGLFINTAVYDYFYRGRVRLGFNLIIKGFSKFHFLMLIWICLFLSSLLIYVGFTFWAKIRNYFKPKSFALKLWDMFCLVLFMSYYPSLMYFPTLYIIGLELPYAASITLFAEITRFLMKMHAYVRSNAPRVLKYKLHAENQILCPKFSQFLYFSFAPTLVYQDNYPRTKYIRWNYVILCFSEVLGVIFYHSFLFEQFLVEIFEDYGIKPYKWYDVVMIMLRNSPAGMLIMLTTHYAVLHAWMNAFAEMLRFSDRVFYKDWWTSNTHERYYRTWNVIIHDWLYTYVYKDFYEIILPKNKLAAKFIVFFISAIFHEYILGFTFRFCLPILFLQFFGLGVALTFLKIKNNLAGNVLLWYTHSLGMGINTSLYAMEYFSRVHCPIENPTLSSYFIPRLLSCNK